MSEPYIRISLKHFLDISTIHGTAEGMAHIENMRDFNKEGIVRGLNRIAELAKEITKNGELIDNVD